MIRTFSYTGRKEIDAQRVSVVLWSDSRNEHSFDAQINLDGMRLPANAKVYVEAFLKSSFMRFDFGTVGTIVEPSDRRLSLIDTKGQINFRVKIVDEREEFGRILADIDNVIPRERDEEDASRIPLLPVQLDELSELVWKLAFEASGPILYLNNGVPRIKELARSSEQFLGLVYPAVVREILLRIVLVEQVAEPNLEGNDWASQWLNYMNSIGVRPFDLSTVSQEDLELDEKLAWIEDAVRQFSLHYRLGTTFINGISGEQR